MREFLAQTKAGEKPKNWWWITALLALALIARIVFLGVYDYIFDDAYITFRYARNIISGLGFVYNAGHPVYGASSPLYTLVTSLIAVAVPDQMLPAFARWIGCLGLFGFVLIVWILLPVEAIFRTATVMALLSYPRIFYSSLGGMEECVILLLMGLSFWAIYRRSEMWGGIACGALSVAKIDSLAWIACLIFAAALLEKRVPWRMILWTVIIALPWVIFASFYFGSPIPHTIEAKRIAYAATARFDLLDAVTLAVPDAFKSTPWVVVCFAFFTYGTIAAAVWRVARTKEWAFLSFPLYCFVYVLVLMVSGTSSGLWTRWTVPLWGALIVSSGYAVALIPLSWSRYAALSTRSIVRGATLLVFCAMLLSPFVYLNRRYLEVTSFRDMGTWLRDNANHSDSVILEPIGLVGFLSGVQVYDFIGLVNPSVTVARSSSGLSNRWFVRYLRETEPTYVVLRDLEVQRNEFLYGGYGDKVFTPDERMWFDNNYRETFRTRTGPEVDRLVLFRKLLLQ